MTHLQNFETLFIITYGRSGSTLLSGVLNSIDGYSIKGENNNFLFPIFNSYCRLLDANQNHGGLNANVNTDPWWGVNDIDIGQFIRDARMMIDNQIIKGQTPRVYGFKEIRYPLVSDQGKLDAYLDFIRLVYPGTRYIFNFRNMLDVMQSKWWAKQNPVEKKASTESLYLFEKLSCEYIEKNQEFCYLINYEDIIQKTEKLRSMFSFLGETYDEEKIDNVLNIRHSY